MVMVSTDFFYPRSFGAKCGGFVQHATVWCGVLYATARGGPRLGLPILLSGLETSSAWALGWLMSWKERSGAEDGVVSIYFFFGCFAEVEWVFGEKVGGVGNVGAVGVEVGGEMCMWYLCGYTAAVSSFVWGSRVRSIVVDEVRAAPIQQPVIIPTCTRSYRSLTSAAPCALSLSSISHSHRCSFHWRRR